MDPSNLDQPHLLRDLALVYLTLAHGTDEALDDTEVGAMADLLRAWSDGSASEGVIEAIEAALVAYQREDALRRVNQAIANVRRAVEQPNRQRLLDDLVEIALADGEFVHEEGAFIGKLAEAWEVAAAQPSAGVSSAAWSVLRAGTPADEAEGWTPLHDLALVYLTLAYETDENLSRGEADVITQKIGEWMPDADDAEVNAVVRDVLSAYVQGLDQEAYARAVASVGRAIPDHQHGALLGDLIAIAHADGKLLETEVQMIRDLAEAWGLNLSEDDLHERGPDEDFDEAPMRPPKQPEPEPEQRT